MYKIPENATVSIEMVTPEMAKEWLKYNDRNRNISEEHVTKWTKEITSGNWKLTNDAICLSAKGELLNSQHRLRAVIASNSPVPFIVVRNFPEESFFVMDSGKRRMLRDALKTSGARHCSEIASLISIIYGYEKGRLYTAGRGSRISHSTGLMLYNKYKDRLVRAASLYLACRRNQSLLPQGAILSILFYFEGNNAAIEKLVDGANLSTNSPILMWRKWVENCRAQKSRITSYHIFLSAINAWNMEEQGIPTTHFKDVIFGLKDEKEVPQIWKGE